jgi:hypothetical protein
MTKEMKIYAATEMPTQIKSKADLERYYWYTGNQVNHLDDHSNFIKLLSPKCKLGKIDTGENNNSELKYKIIFPQSKYPAYAYFKKLELYKIAL